MSIKLIDGCQHYTTTNMAPKWTSAGVNQTLDTTYQRFSGLKSWRCNIGSASHVERIFDANYAEAIFGAAFYFPSTSAFFASANTNSFAIMGTVEGSSNQLNLRITPDRKLKLFRDTTELLASTDLITLDTWVFIEWKLQIANSTSTNKNVVRVTQGGIVTTFLNLSASSDTQATGNAYFNRLRMNGSVKVGADAMVAAWVDFYWIDPTDAVGAVDFLGDRRVNTVYPDGNGNSSQFTGSDGNSTNNYLLVDEATPNDDTDYVESGTVGHIDLYSFGDVAVATSIDCVQTVARVKKTDAGARTAKTMTRIAGTNYEGPEFAPDSTYSYALPIQEVSPATGIAWTLSELNGSEFGLKVQS